MSFIKQERSVEVLELIQSSPNAFILLTVIAQRAKRSERPANQDILMGEAKIGDHENYNMKRQEYRTALKVLLKFKYITVKPTSKGTVAKLELNGIYDINLEEANHQPNQQLTFIQPSTNHQLTTNKKPIKQEVKEDIYTAHFENFWSVYDFKKDKKKVKAEFVRILKSKKLTFDELMNHVKPYVLSTPKYANGDCFRKAPLNWLKGENWNDEIKKPRKSYDQANRNITEQNYDAGTSGFNSIG